VERIHHLHAASVEIARRRAEPAVPKSGEVEEQCLMWDVHGGYTDSLVARTHNYLFLPPAPSGLGGLARTAAPNGPKEAQRAVSWRDAPHGSVYSLPRFLHDWALAFEKWRKSPLGSRSLLGAYVASLLGLNERCEAVFRCPNPVSRQSATAGAALAETTDLLMRRSSSSSRVVSCTVGSSSDGALSGALQRGRAVVMGHRRTAWNSRVSVGSEPMHGWIGCRRGQ
jgi:hypothetical protein